MYCSKKSILLALLIAYVIVYARIYMEAYALVDPQDVISPKNRWTLLKILYKENDWSLALGQWDNEPCLAARWNGSESPDSKGNPVSHGMPTWFVLPKGIAKPMLDLVPSEKDWVSRLLNL